MFMGTDSTVVPAINWGALDEIGAYDDLKRGFFMVPAIHGAPDEIGACDHRLLFSGLFPVSWRHQLVLDREGGGLAAARETELL